MGESTTARFGMPLLHAGQAQKELDHNEALTLLDLAVQPVVRAIGLNEPPSDPGEGDCWLVGASPVGAWSGHAQALAGWTAGGWRFVAPRPGMAVFHGGDQLTVRHDGTGWIAGTVHASRLRIADHDVVGAQQAPITNPAGGGVVDGEAREAVIAVLEALRSHGLIGT